jgi:hypothetical protein
MREVPGDLQWWAPLADGQRQWTWPGSSHGFLLGEEEEEAEEGGREEAVAVECLHLGFPI